MGDCAPGRVGDSAGICLLELKLGLVAGGIADVGGLMVIVALIGMLVGSAPLHWPAGRRVGVRT